MGLTIGGRVDSHNVNKVLWLADEIGLAYDRHALGGKFGMDGAYLAYARHVMIPLS